MYSFSGNGQPPSDSRQIGVLRPLHSAEPGAPRADVPEDNSSMKPRNRFPILVVLFPSYSREPSRGKRQRSLKGMATFSVIEMGLEAREPGRVPLLIEEPTVLSYEQPLQVRVAVLLTDSSRSVEVHRLRSVRRSRPDRPLVGGRPREAPRQARSYRRKLGKVPF